MFHHSPAMESESAKIAQFRQSFLLKKGSKVFKLNQLALAITSALLSSQVMAAVVAPADIASARSNSKLQEAWISGSSAPTYNVFQGFSHGCDPGTLASFNTSSATGVVKPGSSGNFMAYACTRGGKVSVMYHTIDGGSYNAFAPHIDGLKLSRLKALDSPSSTCVLQAGSTFSAGTNQPAVTVYNKCTAAVGATAIDAAPTLPDGGFSDVEAALFGKEVYSVGTQSPANYGQVFGIVVSVPLYRAMQVAQGVYADVATAASSDPDFLPANAPTISTAEYVSIVTGTVPDWSALLGAYGKDNNGHSRPIYLGRRTKSSGTQASSNALFLRNPCNGDPTIGGALAAVEAADSTDTMIITEDSSTGTLKARFNTSNFVIGVMSLENNWRIENNANGGYRYVKLDGVHPEAPVPGSGTVVDLNGRYTAANGKYGYHIEMVNFIANTATPFGSQVIQDITSAFQNTPCSDVPRGMTLNPFSGSSCPAGAQVARSTRFGNNCQAQQMFWF